MTTFSLNDNKSFLSLTITNNHENTTQNKYYSIKNNYEPIWWSQNYSATIQSVFLCTLIYGY